MGVVRLIFSSTNSSQLIHGFRKAQDSSPGPDGDVDDSTEACRKAAAWAWHNRAGGDAVPTRRSVEKIAAAVVGNSKIDRPKSRFRAEAMSESDCDSTPESKSVLVTDIIDVAVLSSLIEQIALCAKALRQESSPDNSFALAKSRFRGEAMSETDCDSTPESKSTLVTDIFDAAVLSSLIEQIALCAKALRQESSPDNSFALGGGGVDTLNQPACDPFPISDGQSKSCQFHPQKSDEREFAALPHPTFSSHSGDRLCQNTNGKLKARRDCDPSKCKSREKKLNGSHRTDHFVEQSVPTNINSASFRKSLPLMQRLFQKISKGNDSSHSSMGAQVHNHHHYYHHHHYQYHPSSRELQTILEQPRARQRAESFSVHTEREVEDQEDRETQRIRRNSGSDYATTYSGDAVGDGATEADYDCDYSPDQQWQPVLQEYLSNVPPTRRSTESFSVSTQTHRESPGMRRHSSEFGASPLNWAHLGGAEAVA